MIQRVSGFRFGVGVCDDCMVSIYGFKKGDVVAKGFDNFRNFWVSVRDLSRDFSGFESRICCR